MSGISTKSCLPSDHAAITCNLLFDRPQKVTKHVITRKLKNIDMDKFHHDILDVSSSALISQSNVDSLTNHLCSGLRETLNNHAPLADREIILRPDSP